MQVPQSSIPPQPSAIVPQSATQAAHVVGVQPQTFGVPPPPQVLNPVQVLPQLSVPPQSPLGIVPHFPAHVLAVQQVPKSGFPFPGAAAGFMQLRLQQVMFV